MTSYILDWNPGPARNKEVKLIIYELFDYLGEQFAERCKKEQVAERMEQFGRAYELISKCGNDEWGYSNAATKKFAGEWAAWAWEATGDDGYGPYQTRMGYKESCEQDLLDYISRTLWAMKDDEVKKLKETWDECNGGKEFYTAIKDLGLAKKVKMIAETLLRDRELNYDCDHIFMSKQWAKFEQEFEDNVLLGDEMDIVFVPEDGTLKHRSNLSAVDSYSVSNALAFMEALDIDPLDRFRIAAKDDGTLLLFKGKARKESLRFATLNTLVHYSYIKPLTPVEVPITAESLSILETVHVIKDDEGNETKTKVLSIPAVTRTADSLKASGFEFVAEDLEERMTINSGIVELITSLAEMAALNVCSEKSASDKIAV